MIKAEEKEEEERRRGAKEKKKKVGEGGRAERKIEKRVKFTESGSRPNKRRRDRK